MVIGFGMVLIGVAIAVPTVLTRRKQNTGLIEITKTIRMYCISFS